MSLIDREATFRSKGIADHAVSLTAKSECPQLVARLIATEIWDPEEQEWVDWSGYDQNEITAYFVLFSGKGEETLTCNQVKKVTGWSGLSFQELNDMDLSETGIQFRVENSVYYPPEGEPRDILKVNWIDEYDAEPGRAVRKLDPEDLKKLDAKYKSMLKATSGKTTKPAKAKPKPVNKPPKIGPKPLDIPQADEATNEQEEPKKQPGTIQVKGAKATKTAKPVSKKSKPAIPTAPGETHDTCTKQEAWDTVVEVRRDDVDDEALAKAWLNAVQQHGGGKPQDLLNENEWAAVRDTVLKQVAKF